MSKKRFVIGVSGRSGSGKSTLVNRIMQYFGTDNICLHTMDNYYLPRALQICDENNYHNFDLPTSIMREAFAIDLKQLKNGKIITLREYTFNNQSKDSSITINSTPIILVEGLFVYHFDEIRNALDYKVMMDVSFDICYQRRLKRDQLERNYSVTEINYRFNAHVEPAYQSYIQPYEKECDLMIRNEASFESGWNEILSLIHEKIR